MNLKALPSLSMVSISDWWLTEPLIRGEVDKHPLGAAACTHLQEAYDELTLQERLRNRIAADIASLGEELQAFGAAYARNARALHNHLDALAESTDDPELAARYRDIKRILFPDGLRLIQRSYVEEAGAVLAMERWMTPDILALLADTPVGKKTLADLHRGWVVAGKALGEKAQERARLQASIGREGTIIAQASGRQVRYKWIRAAHLFLTVIDALPLSAEVREKIYAPLEQRISDVLRRTGDAANDSELPDGSELPADSAEQPAAAAQPAAVAARPAAVAARPAAASKPAAAVLDTWDNAAEPEQWNHAARPDTLVAAYVQPRLPGVAVREPGAAMRESGVREPGVRMTPTLDAPYVGAQATIGASRTGPPAIEHG